MGPFPQHEIVSWAVDLLDTLEYLHSRTPPIIHRDIKPANLKLTVQGRIILLDFGLSKGSAGQMSTVVETPHSIQGFTRDYASLEQVHCTGTDERSDIFSLGATLYHLITGEKPISAPDRYAAIEDGKPDPLVKAGELNGTSSEEVSALLVKATALRARDRFVTAKEMREAFKAFLTATGNSTQRRATQSESILNVDRGPQDPDLAYALEVDREMGFKAKLKQWRTTEEGVDAAKENVKLLFAELSDLAKKSNNQLRHIYLGEFPSAEDTFRLCGAGFCLSICWECPYANTLAESRLVIEVYQARLDSTGGAVPIDDRRKHHSEYHLDLDRSLEVGWQRKGADSRLTSTRDLARSCMSSLLSTIRNATEDQ